MKGIVMANNYGASHESEEIGWYLLADSAVTNTGKPFYLPDFMGETKVSLTVAIRITRLGKSIEPRFASRYFTEYAPALHFTLPEYAERLKKEGLPEDGARSFDRSLFVGEFLPMEDEEPIRLINNGRETAVFRFDNLRQSVEKSICSVSQLNTLKIGDILMPGLSGMHEIKEGDFLEVVKGEERLFYVKVR